MGYACPVCATPQRDGEHLAHHLAFTAMIHGDDHEAWLDEHAPGWETQDPEGLADDVTPHAEEAEYVEVFEDTTDRERPDVGGEAGVGGHGGHGHGGHVDSPDPANLDPETADVLREARELTREMYADDGEGDEGETGHGSDEDGKNGEDGEEPDA